MPRKKRSFQTRLSRSARMQGATVKRAIGADPARVRQKVVRRHGVETVEPTPTIDAALATLSNAPIRRALIEIGFLVGMMVLLTLILVSIEPAAARRTSTGNLYEVVVIMAAATAFLALIVVIARLYQRRSIRIRLSNERRVCLVATGRLQVQERAVGVFGRRYYLRAPGGEWTLMESDVMTALEPILVARIAEELPFDRRTGSDVRQEWTVPDATILFHPPSGTVLDVHDDQGDLVYRHPRYRPDA